MDRFLIVGLGGFAGATARYAVAALVQRRFNGSFPAGTLAVNLLGCLVIGALMCLVERLDLLAARTRLFLLVGFLGSFTTLSTVGYETFEFLKDRETLVALANAGANMLLGIVAVAAGWFAVKALLV